jgi:hypothetical protein
MGRPAQGENEMSAATKTVVETHSATIINASNTDFLVQGSGLRMTFIGGSNDVVAFPQESKDQVIAVNTTNLSINASSANDLSVLVAGAVVGMQIGGWGAFAAGQTLTLFDEGRYALSINAVGRTALISGLDPGRHGSIAFFDSALQPSQITAIDPRLFG